MIRRILMMALLALLMTNVVAAEQSKPEIHMGPVIKDFGPYVNVPEDSFMLNKNQRYKAFMDITDGAAEDDALNRNFESAARFLNMNASSGVDAANMELALVIHGSAVKDLFTDEAYQAQFQKPNPNTGLLEALHSAGVEIYVCGQSLGFRGNTMEQLNPAVKLAISAMSTSIRLQSEGFNLIP